MKKFILDLEVTSIEQLHERYVLIKLTSGNIPLPDMMPGQFVEVHVTDSPTTYLRRPISVNYVDKWHNELWLLVATIGAGTRSMANLKVGDLLNCVLPLGNSFTVPEDKNKKILLVGGGVGIAPLLYFGKRLSELDIKPVFLLGAKSKKDLLELNYFSSFGRVYLTTEDGSEGEKGFVTQHSILKREHFDQISTCGPKPMMMAVARYARQNSIECEASLENMMACGLGACLCCVEKTTEGNLCVCKEGPVLNIKKLLWQL
jgi:dihydroorotate dehydrogenase electron transfer subunit